MARTFPCPLTTVRRSRRGRALRAASPQARDDPRLLSELNRDPFGAPGYAFLRKVDGNLPA